jgi:hypothetical protein
MIVACILAGLAVLSLRPIWFSRISRAVVDGFLQGIAAVVLLWRSLKLAWRRKR